MVFLSLSLSPNPTVISYISPFCRTLALMNERKSARKLKKN